MDTTSSSQPTEQVVPGFKLDSKRLEYQQAAKMAAIEYYKENDNGILSMPCGTGKTYVSYLIAQDYKNVIILSPLKQFAKQNIVRFVEYGYPTDRTLIVDSDGCRDIETIRKFITSDSTKSGFLLSATYDSSDVISALMADIEVNTARTLIIVDEFHNLSESNICEETDYMNQIITSIGFKKLFMSATPRVFDLEETGDSYDYILGTPFYTMPFKFAIDNGFITDYRIWLPSIHEDLGQLHGEIGQELGIADIIGGENVLYSKAIYLFSCLVNTGAHKCIVYCPDTNEIRELMDLMAKLNDFYCLDLHMDSITSVDSAESREKSLAEFASSQRTSLLFSVRILDECIDIPSCDSIYITYPTKAKIRTIQRLMRCTRTLPADKHKVGNVFIWCSEYERILDTLGGIKEHDSDFAEKVKINEVGQYRERENSGAMTEIKDDTEAVKKLIIGVKEYRYMSWHKKLNLLKAYLDENKKRPNKRDTDPILKTLGEWISTQIKNYSSKVCIMADSAIYTAWTEFINNPQYSEYFMDNNAAWNNNLSELKAYLDENKKRPCQKDKDPKTKKLGIWCTNQIKNYSSKVYIMTDSAIYTAWTEFINNSQYSMYLIDKNTVWNNNFTELKAYLDKNKKRPSEQSKDLKIKTLGRWCSIQITNYNKKSRIMADSDIYTVWTEFINNPQYSEYFIDNHTAWYYNLTELKNYLDANNKRPCKESDDTETKILGSWCSTQIKNYGKKEYIMSDHAIYTAWTEFINNPQYSEYFIGNNTAWNNNLSELKAYLDANKKKPSKYSKDPKTKQLGTWYTNQIKNYNNKAYIMSDSAIYTAWSEFINNPQYSEYFNNNNTTWKNNLSELKTYVDENKKRPSKESKDPKTKKLGIWCTNQIINYKSQKYIMNNTEIRTEWLKFITNEKYKVYLS